MAAEQNKNIVREDLNCSVSIVVPGVGSVSVLGSAWLQQRWSEAGGFRNAGLKWKPTNKVQPS